MIKKPTLEEVNNVDMSPMYPLFNYFPHVINGDVLYISKAAGEEHYRLLGWISKQLNNSTIVEIGTCDGMGLLALCLNPSNKVVSFDIMDYERKHKVPPNGSRRYCSKNFDHFDIVNKSEFVFYDANHNGKTEREFLDSLSQMGWKGQVLFDDIYFNDQMRSFWEALPYEKEDWTDIGHKNCGTGMVNLK